MSIRHFFTKPWIPPLIAISTMLQLGAPCPLLTPAYADTQAGTALPYPAVPTDPSPAGTISTTTPIKHVVIIVGENFTFDHAFATYIPVNNQSIANLRSAHIVNADGTPGLNYLKAAQYSAEDYTADGFLLSPRNKKIYDTLPPPLYGTRDTDPFSSIQAAQQGEPFLDSAYYLYLTQYPPAVLFDKSQPDPRIHYFGRDATDLPPGPFQITSTPYNQGVDYHDYTGGQTHSFFQEWQEHDCSTAQATRQNPSGCLADLLTWVEDTAGFQKGGRAMGFYNMATGDVPYFKSLADTYAISDNYHQPIMGASLPNHLYLAYADDLSAEDANLNPVNASALRGSSTAAKGTNNQYGDSGAVNCSDATQSGVGSILNYLKSLSPPINPNCDNGHWYYLLNQPSAFNPNGVAMSGKQVITPIVRRSLGDAMDEKNISWAWYSEQWQLQVNGANATNAGCCDPYLNSARIMKNPAERTLHVRDLADFYTSVTQGTLPAVSYIKPGGIEDGHTGNSKPDLFEGFCKKVIDTVKSNPGLWQDTAILITVDEGGGFYDSGYIQPVDFFGDGPRIPMIVVSPYSVGGKVSHVYNDHASFVKFVERNWGLKPLTTRSRDNLPNPTPGATPYIPCNTPAIGDMTDLFTFVQPANATVSQPVQ